MMRSLRKAAISIGIKKDVDEDAGAKKRLQDIRDAHDTLKRHINAYVRTVADAGVHIAHMHESLADVYPAGQALSAQLESLHNRSPVFNVKAKEAAEASKAELEAALLNLEAKHKEMTKLIADRSSYRQDIIHYEEKLPALEAKAATSPKDAQKLAENKAKLDEVRHKFADADAAAIPELEKLDSVVADLVGNAFRAYMDSQAKYYKSVSENFEAALAGVPADPPAAAEGVAPTSEEQPAA